MAFNFPMQTSTGPDSKQKKRCKAKPRQGKVRIRHWGDEDVDVRVRKLLTRNRTHKPVRKRENQKKVITQTKKPLGKFGRGDAPHEYWEEERRIREKKKSEKLAKKGKPKPDEVRPVPTLTDEPSSETEKAKVEIPSKFSSLNSSTEHEQKEKEEMDLGSSYIKDVRSYEVLDNSKFEVQIQVDNPPLTSSTESNLEDARQMDLGSTYIKDKISHKVFHNSKFKVKTQSEDPSLTSSSESEQEEDSMDSKSTYIKAARSDKVFHHLKARAICPTILREPFKNVLAEFVR